MTITAPPTARKRFQHLDRRIYSPLCLTLAGSPRVPDRQPPPRSSEPRRRSGERVRRLSGTGDGGAPRGAPG